MPTNPPLSDTEHIPFHHSVVQRALTPHPSLNKVVCTSPRTDRSKVARPTHPLTPTSLPLTLPLKTSTLNLAHEDAPFTRSLTRICRATSSSPTHNMNSLHGMITALASIGWPKMNALWTISHNRFRIVTRPRCLA